MTSGEAFPFGPDDHGQDPHLFDVSIDQEYLDRQGLVANLQLYYQAVQEVDDTTSDAHVKLRSLAASMPQSRFYIRTEDPRVVDALYDEIIWTPKEGTRTAETVESVAVRHPIIDDPKYGVWHGFDDQEPVTPNDVLIEITDKRGERYRYLLNDYGLQSYPDAEMLEFDDTELLSPERPSNQAPNVFKVLGDFWVFPPLTAAELRNMLIGDSQITPITRS